jgi:hypothetical protein
MKRCPTCKRTFEDGLTYCLIDGSVLSAPFEEEEADVDSRSTEVLVESTRTAPPTERMAPAQTTVAAVSDHQPPRRPAQELTPAESKPVALIGIIGLVTVLYSVAIVVLLLANWETVSPYFGWLIVRRIPIFLLGFIAILVALIRIRHHMRASLLAILAVIVYVMQGFFFYLFNSSLINVMSKMKLSPWVSEWLYFFIYFCEDFIFAAVIILLVVAAFIGRKQFSKLMPETI